MHTLEAKDGDGWRVIAESTSRKGIDRFLDGKPPGDYRVVERETKTGLTPPGGSCDLSIRENQPVREAVIPRTLLPKSI